MNDKLAFVIVAAGSSQRFGDQCKLTADIEVDGVRGPVISFSVREALKLAESQNIVLVYGEHNRSALASALQSQPDLVDVMDQLGWVPGGTRRQDSVVAALTKLKAQGFCGPVAVHDGARPFFKSTWLTPMLEKLMDCDGVILGRTAVETVKRVTDDGKVVETPARETLMMAETPQLFDLDLLLHAYSSLDPSKSVTDDASVMEFLGKSVYVVTHFGKNPKITFASDL